MRYILSIKLFKHIQQNYPDVLLSLPSEEAITDFINQKLDEIEPLIDENLRADKPVYIVEEIGLTSMIEALGPSKFNYLKELVEDEFLIEYHHLLQAGVLKFEILNLITECDPFFEAFGFSEENIDDKHLRYTIVGTIKEYFENSEKENCASWPTAAIINS